MMQHNSNIQCQWMKTCMSLCQRSSLWKFSGNNIYNKLVILHYKSTTFNRRQKSVEMDIYIYIGRQICHKWLTNTFLSNARHTYFLCSHGDFSASLLRREIFFFLYNIASFITINILHNYCHYIPSPRFTSANKQREKRDRLIDYSLQTRPH